ncbi:MAG: hypothetical protein J7L34_04665 [Thermotogaceae bacterium]|nr:hypothetical protein [Thermotogaceae bacterium]
MRKCVLLLFLYLLLSTIASAVVLKDVSPTLPEFEAVEFMVNKGIMNADNGYFKGPKVVTKFDLAVYLYNFYKFMIYSFPLQSVEGTSNSTESSEGAPSNSYVTEEKVKIPGDHRVDMILNLLEYDPERNDFGRITDLEKRVIALNDFVANLPGESEKVPDISGINNKLSGISDKVNSIEEMINSINDDYHKLEDTVSQQRMEVEKINMLLQSQEKMISDNTETLNEMKSSYLELKEKCDFIVKEVNILENELNTLKYMMSSYAVKIDTHENTLLNIQYQLSELSDKVKATMVSTEAETHISTSAGLEEYLKEVKALKNELTGVEKLKTDLKVKLKELDDRINAVEGTKEKTDYLMKSTEVLAANQKKLEDSSRNLLILSISSVLLSITAIVTVLIF